MKHIVLGIMAVTALTNVKAQPVPPTPRPSRVSPPAIVYLLPGSPHAPIALLSTMAGENKDDPAYKSYKAAYNLILDEQWDDARNKFAELISKYPSSDYQDDAAYWSAFALMHQDGKKAATAYKLFIEKYPKSRYLDDALADLGKLEGDVHATTPKPSVAWIDKARDGKSYSYGYAYAPNMRQAERQLRQLERRQMHMRLPIGAMTPITPLLPGDYEKLDPELRLKIDALYALGETKQDERGFQTLKEVATDPKQPRALREAALDVLMSFDKFDVTPLLVEIAKNDTSEELQAYAVDYIGEHGKDKNKSVTMLIELFNSVPKQRTSQLEAIFYSIAEVGNDKAVDFLGHVALNHDNYDLRSNAVYLLGNIGGEKARSALYEVLKGKAK